MTGVNSVAFLVKLTTPTDSLVACLAEPEPALLKINWYTDTYFYELFLSLT